jgi:hypothetical protein
MKKLIIFDFDGTLTDAEQEGFPFKDGYLEDIATLVGKTLADIKPRAEFFEQEIAQNPQAYGWVFQGQIVAPATVDPYLRMMPIARKLLDDSQVLMNGTERERVLDGILYKYNYKKTKYAFRSSTLPCLQSLLGESVYIVTNSHTDAVQNKLQYLEQQRVNQEVNGMNQCSILPYVERVHGRARKYMIEPSFDQVPAELILPKLSRPVLLRRKHYFDVLNELRLREGVEWQQVFVFGDIFELDLSLPLALGATVGLMQNEFTPAWEIEFLQNHPKGFVLQDLMQIPQLLIDQSSQL